MTRALIRGIVLLIASVMAVVTWAQHTISFARELVKDHHHLFVIDSVIIAFNDTACIGEVQNEFKVRPQRAYLEGGVARQLSTLLKRSFVADNTKRHVVLKVDRLTIAEGSFGGSQFGSAGICVEFLRQDPAGFVREYLHGTTVVSKAIDVTHLHTTNIQQALEDCLAAYDRANTGGKLTALPIRIEQLRRVPGIEEMGLPILSTGKPRTGIYHTFMDMAHDEPDTSVPFRLKRNERNDGTTTAELDSEGPVTTKGIWGVCDHGDVFINNGKRLVLADRDITGFHVTFDRSSSASDPNAATLGALGGVLGGVAFGALFAAGVSNSAISPPAAYDLDMLTGQLLPRKVTRIGTNGSELSETVIVNSTSDSLPIEVTMFGGREALLKAGQHHWVRSIRRDKPLVLGINVNDQAGPSFNIDTSLPNPQVYVITREADGLKCTAAANAEAVVSGLNGGDQVE